jgi:PEP-CTERM motif
MSATVPYLGYVSRRKAMILGRLFGMSAIGIALLVVPDCGAAAIAYDAAVQLGNQSYSGSLGLDFDVISSPVNILSLGAFDASADGLNGPVSVGIYNRNTQTLVSPLLVFSGAVDALLNGSRFRSITPLTLGAGQYSVVAWGYGPNELNGNAGCVGNPAASCFGTNPFTGSTMNGEGVIAFVGGGRFGAAGSYPTGPDGGPANRYLAGTFEFEAAVPEPATTGLMGLVFTGFAIALRRTKKA